MASGARHSSTCSMACCRHLSAHHCAHGQTCEPCLQRSVSVKDNTAFSPPVLCRHNRNTYGNDCAIVFRSLRLRAGGERYCGWRAGNPAQPRDEEATTDAQGAGSSGESALCLNLCEMHQRRHARASAPAHRHRLSFNCIRKPREITAV
jgi:hypothetical protein